MNVTLCSAFRSSAAYIARYQLQVCRLAYALAQRGDWLHVIWCEGDSVDDSLQRLLDGYEHDGKPCGYTADIFHFHHDGKNYGSIEDAQRFRQLAAVWSRVWARIPDDASVVVFCEADLIWEADTIVRLIDQVQDSVAVAPMVMDSPPKNTWYDSWAFRRNGVRFTKEPPFHADFDDPREGYMLLDSAGSVLVMDGDLARKVRFTDEEAVVGLCKNIYAVGGSIWLDTAASVTHP